MLLLLLLLLLLLFLLCPETPLSFLTSLRATYRLQGVVAAGNESQYCGNRTEAISVSKNSRLVIIIYHALPGPQQAPTSAQIRVTDRRLGAVV